MTKRSVVGVVVALAVSVALAACGVSTVVKAKRLQQSLKHDYASDAHVSPGQLSVSCPKDQEAKAGKQFDCTLTLANGKTITLAVTLTNDQGDYRVVTKQPE